ncbi:MAG: amidohydrolase family protein [Vreelandella alkaliphila]|uniref:amidohydrolase family protein n=1 Tax=Halomonadaceae TaxID=28256 RepID=UPI0021F803D0|nr:amidohydrolase family protein [Halomonas sp. 3A7M]
MAEITRRQMIGGTAAVMALFAGLHVPFAVGQQPKAHDGPLLLTNFKLFDGNGGPLRDGVSIRVENGRIDAILDGSGEVDGIDVVDCGGRVLMPGLIDAHWHTTLAAISQMEAMTADIGYVHLVAAREAERTLMRGVTSVRDVGGAIVCVKACY